MGRLRQIAPRLQVALLSRLTVATGRAATERERDTQSWRKWYKTGRWKVLRLAVLKRCHWTCGMCSTVCGGRGQAIVDHRKPHRGDAALFWDDANLWCLCKPCHDRVKAREEARVVRT